MDNRFNVQSDEISKRPTGQKAVAVVIGNRLLAYIYLNTVE